FVTQGDQVGRAMIISWVTVDEPGSNTVVYWPENTKLKHSAEGTVLTYKYTNYISGWIDTKYFYEVGLGLTTRQFWFTTPPQIGPDVPYTFGFMGKLIPYFHIITSYMCFLVCLSVGLNVRAGDLGQTYDSNRTLTHYESNPSKGQTVLFVGDKSYADHYPLHENHMWDSLGRFAERSTAYQPWI
ncbi:hypothetical protein GIB67_029488, partial [Kingdonia uniflora]